MSDSQVNHPSLEEVHRTVSTVSRHWWRRLLAFIGPAYMVSVGYMDPGNWATDLAGGSRFGYTLLWVLLMSNAMAVLLQTLSARLGIVTGHDLAQACRDEYPPAVRYVLFVLTEIAIAATDLAEVLGSAVGLNLLFGIPLLWAVIVTAGDVLLLLLIQRLGIRKMEAFIVMLVSTIGICFIIEIFLTRPSVDGIVRGFVPGQLEPGALYVAIGMLGATVMPHNLYLHSALVQSRDVARSRQAVAQACKYNLIDSVIAMNGAFVVNAAILIVAAAVFFEHGLKVENLQDAPALLRHLLGSTAAPILFGIALLAAGQSSTLTGTLAGQISMEGFLNFRMRPWLRRLMTRSLAITPAIIAVAVSGPSWVFKLLILSQVILSLQLPFAVAPLVRFTSSRRKMGPFVSRWWVKLLAWAATAAIVVLNAMLAYDVLAPWVSQGRVAFVLSAAAALLLAALLAWMVFRPERVARQYRMVNIDQIVATAAAMQKKFERIGVALEAKATDAAMLAEALALARANQAQLVLLHVVEGVGGQWYGPQTGDMESRQDQAYLDALVQRLRESPGAKGVPAIRAVLGFGDVPKQIVRLARENQIDLLVVGGHGHKGLADLIHGQTINDVRHGLTAPILAVR